MFIAALRSLNYVVDWRVLCAADYGAPTSRRRLFIQCVRKDCVQIEVEKATSEEAVESINLKNGDYLITVKKICADNKDLLTLQLPFSAKTDIRECLKSVHNRLCWCCDIDRWSKESEDIFMTFNYGINEVLSNIAKNEAKEKESK